MLLLHVATLTNKGKAAEMNTPRTRITMLLLLFITKDQEPRAIDWDLTVTGVQTPEPHYHFSAYHLATQLSLFTLLGATIFSSTFKIPPVYRETVSLEFFKDLKLVCILLSTYAMGHFTEISISLPEVDYLRCTECSKMYKGCSIILCKMFSEFLCIVWKRKCLTGSGINRGVTGTKWNLCLFPNFILTQLHNPYQLVIQARISLGLQ